MKETQRPVLDIRPEPSPVAYFADFQVSGLVGLLVPEELEVLFVQGQDLLALTTLEGFYRFALKVEREGWNAALRESLPLREIPRFTGLFLAACVVDSGSCSGPQAICASASGWRSVAHGFQKGKGPAISLCRSVQCLFELF